MNRRYVVPDGEAWAPYAHGRVYQREVAGGLDRLAIGVDSDQIETLVALAEDLEGRITLMFALLQDVRGIEAARYTRRDELSFEETAALLRRHRLLLEENGQINVWVHSRFEDRTLVLDQHNVLYAYGMLPRFEHRVKRLGYVEGEILKPCPHGHYWGPSADDLFLELFASYADWERSPLEPGADDPARPED